MVDALMPFIKMSCCEELLVKVRVESNIVICNVNYTEKSNYIGNNVTNIVCNEKK